MTDKRSWTDEALIRSVLGGDTETYALLVERHTPRVFGLAFHLCGDYDTAADLTQETLIAAYQALDRVRDLQAFPGWLAGILRNKHRNLGRQRSRKSALSLDALMESGFDPPDPDSRRPEREDELRRIWQAVESLPAGYREALSLRYSDDLSYKEIAQCLGLSVTTVTSRLAHARAALARKAKEMGLL